MIFFIFFLVLFWRYRDRDKLKGQKLMTIFTFSYFFCCCLLKTDIYEIIQPKWHKLIDAIIWWESRIFQTWSSWIIIIIFFYSWESIISYLQKIWTENYQNQWNFFAWNWNWSHCINWWATCLSNGHDPNFLSPRSSQIILFFFHILSIFIYIRAEWSIDIYFSFKIG